MGDIGWGVEGIVWFDCDHSVNPCFWVLRKRAPFYKGVNPPVFVDFFERVLGSITALRSHVQCSTYHMYASAWAETTGLVLKPNPSLKRGCWD